MKNRVFTIFLFLLLGACRSHDTIGHYRGMPEETWDRQNTLTFEMQIPDSGAYNLNICIRHTTDYVWTDLWCIVKAYSQAPGRWQDTVDVRIALPDGQWAGQGGGLKTVKQPVNKNPITLPSGKVIFEIIQAMDQKQLLGIENVGIELKPIAEDKYNYGKK